MKFSHLIRIHIRQLLEEETMLILKGEELHYLSSVMRVKANQEIRVFNGIDGEFLAKILSVSKSQISLQIEKKFRSVEPEKELILALCIIKADRFAESIRAAVQLGVTKIIPVISERVQSRNIARNRIEKIIEQSTQQSERFQIPALADEVSLSDLLELKEIEQIIFAHESAEEGKTIAKLPSFKEKICVLIGPEGGFSNQESELINSYERAQSVSLGPRVLKSEVATISALACVQMMRTKK